MSYVAPFAGSPWWVPVLYIAVLGHITNVCITLYLHRSATHGGVRLLRSRRRRSRGCARLE